jgi:Aldehyde dehydrogenase family
VSQNCDSWTPRSDVTPLTSFIPPDILVGDIAWLRCRQSINATAGVNHEQAGIPHDIENAFCRALRQFHRRPMGRTALRQYFDNVSPVTGQVVCKIARSEAADVETALDAAHAAKDAWGRTSVVERALILNRIADRMEANLERLAKPGTMASRSAKPVPPMFRSRSIIFATSPALSALRRVRSPRSIRTRSPITSMSRSAWSGRSFPGTSRC